MTPGDHLQTAYNLWLPGHQVERAARPWVDPYSFQPVVEPRVNFAGWPFSLVWWPLDALLDTVGAWNAFVLLTYVGAGALTALWLRSLGLSLGAALVGGLAFALAPYRVAQSTGHLLGPISMLLPLSLWGVETRRDWLAAAAIASIPLSGQVHLALGAIPFFVAYAWVRRGWRAAVPGAVASLAAGVLVWATTLRDTAERPFAEVERYSAELGDFVSRDLREFEAFVFLGWLVPLAALAGLVLLARERPRLAIVMGVGALIPALLALGSNLPGYRTLWEHTPLGSTRVPERLMPIACLALAGLLAFAVERVPWRHAALVAAALVAIDLRAGVELYDPLTAGEDDPAHAVVRTVGPGRYLEVPVYAPDAYAGSVYTSTRCRRSGSGRSVRDNCARGGDRRSRSGSSGCSAEDGPTRTGATAQRSASATSPSTRRMRRRPTRAPLVPTTRWPTSATSATGSSRAARASSSASCVRPDGVSADVPRAPRLHGQARRDGRLGREWREHVLPLRQQLGFSVPGAWVVEDERRFVWLLAYDGDDYESANEAYYASPARQAVDPEPTRHLERTEHWPLRPVV